MWFTLDVSLMTKVMVVVVSVKGSTLAYTCDCIILYGLCLCFVFLKYAVYIVYK